MVSYSQPVKLAIVLRLLMGINEHVLAILDLLNLSTAFDMIDKSVLPDRNKPVLRSGGIVLREFSSYLFDHTQSVKIFEASFEIMTEIFSILQ